MTKQDAERAQARSARQQAKVAADREQRERALQPVSTALDFVAKGIQAGLGAAGRVAAAKQKAGKAKAGGEIRYKFSKGSKPVSAPTLNHVSWYTRFKGAEINGNISFQYPANLTSYVQNLRKFASGGLALYTWIPSLGANVGNDSQVVNPSNPNRHADSTVGNLVTQMILRLQEVARKANAGALNYEPSDIGLVVMAVDSIVTQYYELRRAFGLLWKSSPKNWWEHKRAYESIMDESYEFAITGYQSYLQKFAAIKTLMRNFVLPHFTLFDRHVFLASNLFKDARLERSKLHVMRVGFRYTFYEGDGAEVPKHLHAQLRSKGLMNQLNDLIRDIHTLTNYTDFVTIMGDLEKAFPDAVVNLDDTPDGYITEPVYDEAVLDQIENTTLCGELVQGSGTQPSTTPPQYLFTPYDIFDFNGALVQGLPDSSDLAQPISGFWSPFFLEPNGSSSYGNSDWKAWIIDSHTDQPTGEEMLVKTRNMPARLFRSSHPALYDYDSAGTGTLATYGFVLERPVLTNPAITKGIVVGSLRVSASQYTFATASVFYPLSTGTEIFSSVQLIVYGDASIAGADTQAYLTSRGYNPVAMVGGSGITGGYLAMLSNYEHAPRPVYVPDTAWTGGVVWSGGPMNNAIVVSAEYLNRLHYAAVASEFMLS